jgi:hypothetical protein
LGFVERFSERRWVKSLFIFMAWRFGKSLETASCCKTDADKTYDAFADAEQRYRRRYVDLTVNDHVKETFIKRTKCSTPCVLSLTTEAILKWNTCFSRFLVVLQHAHLSHTTTRLTCPCTCVLPMSCI